MFATYAQHKLPLQYPGDPSTVWTGVEMVLNQPFLVCTVDVEGLAQRFFLSQDADVVEMARRTTEDRLTAVDLVVPPEWSEERHWEVLPVKRLMQRREVPSGEPASGLVLITREGRAYAGYPLARTEDADPRSLKLLADFDVRGMTGGV